jgi:type II secretory pathway component GspD/PulD (secretin)
MAAALALVGLASADGTLNGVSVDKSGPGVAVHIKGKDLAQPTKVWVNKGNSLVLDFSGKLASNSTFTKVHKAGLNSVYVEQGDGKVRVYLALNKHETPEITKTADGWDVSFGQSARVASAPKKAAAKSGGVVEPAVSPLEPASDVLARMHGNASAPAGPRAEDASPRVSLDFVNTEVVQILKALAMQTGVNIVTAPEVKGTLTVTLDNVSVKDALDMVTSVAGLSYAKVGNSYIVATPEKIAAASSGLNGKRALLMETRVVPIYSGAGREIRASVFSSFTDANVLGQVHIYLPNEQLAVSKENNFGGVAAPTDKPAMEIKSSDNKDANGSAADVNAGTDKEQVSVKGMKEQYVVLIGPSDKIDEVEDSIKELDRSISKAYGFNDSTDTRLVRKTYVMQSDDVKANDLVKAVASTQPNNFLNVDLYATPAGFKNQSVVIIGRDNEVEKAEALLKDLDQSGYGSETFIYDVQHSDPRSLREALVSQVKGLRVTIPPASVGNTRVYTEGQTVQQSAQTTQAGGDAKGGTAGVNTDAAAKTGQENVQGLTLPFQDSEKVSVPMELVLTGTTEEIDSARKYLKQVDVAAKQVALELRVMELSKEDATKIGLDWEITTGSAAVRTVSLNQGVSDASNTVGIHIGGRKWGGSVTATLDQISNNDNLIARPNLLALDGRESEIFVGDVIRYISSIQSTTNGTTVTTAELPVGVRLSVMPRIGTDSMTLDLRPEVSFLRSFTEIPGGGELPQTSLREAQSTVSIHDGDTIAIGGLIQDQDNYDVSKVPILGDLPIIGRLFQKTNKSKIRKEVVLFLTAKIVNDQPGNIADPRVSDKNIKPEIQTPVKP